MDEIRHLALRKILIEIPPNANLKIKNINEKGREIF